MEKNKLIMNVERFNEKYGFKEIIRKGEKYANLAIK